MDSVTLEILDRIANDIELGAIPVYPGDRVDAEKLFQRKLPLDGIDFGKILKIKEIGNVNVKRQMKFSNFDEFTFKGTNFSGSTLCHASLRDTEGIDASFDNADLCWTDWEGSRMPNCSFKYSWFIGANLTECNFKEAQLQNSVFIGVNASQANFCGADLSNCNFAFSNLSGAVFEDASLAGSCFAYAKQLNPVSFPVLSKTSSADDPFINLDKSNFWRATFSSSNAPDDRPKRFDEWPKQFPGIQIWLEWLLLSGQNSKVKFVKSFARRIHHSRVKRFSQKHFR